MCIVIFHEKFQLNLNNSVEMRVKTVWRVKNCGFTHQIVSMTKMTKKDLILGNLLSAPEDIF